MKLCGCSDESTKAPKTLSGLHTDCVYCFMLIGQTFGWEAPKFRPLSWPHWSQSSALRMKYFPVSEEVYKRILFSHGAAATPPPHILPSGPGLPHFGGFRITLRHTISVGLLLTSDQTDTETST